MDIEKTNNIENISSKEEKLKFLITKIWETLYELSSSDIVNTETLMSLTIQYVKNSFDANIVPTKFEPLEENINAYYSKYEGVKLNSNNFLINTGTFDAIDRYAKFLSTVSHEFTHRNDEFSHEVNNLPKDSRFPHGNGYSSCLKNLGKIFNKPIYEDVGKALYYLSSNEIVAKNVSYGFTKQFAKQLRKITEERLPNRKDCEKHIKEYRELRENGVPIDKAFEQSNCSITDFCSNQMHVSIDHIEEITEIKNETAENLPLLYEAIININLQETQQAFFEQCSKYLSGNCTEDELKDFDQTDMATLLTKPEFYNKTLAEKLYANAQTDKSLSYDIKVKTLGKLSSIEDLKIPAKERQENLDNYDEYIKILAQINENEK